MARKKIKIQSKRRLPRFKTVREESEFWDRHSPLDYGAWEEVSYEDILGELEARGERKVQVSLRLERKLVSKLKRVAAEHRIPYQKLARELLWRAVSRLTG